MGKSLLRDELGPGKPTKALLYSNPALRKPSVNNAVSDGVSRKEKDMPEQGNNRVLGRVGARLLKEEELNHVSGGLRTGLCTFDPKTCALDGDCSPPPAC